MTSNGRTAEAFAQMAAWLALDRTKLPPTFLANLTTNDQDFHIEIDNINQSWVTPGKMHQSTIVDLAVATNATVALPRTYLQAGKMGVRLRALTALDHHAASSNSSSSPNLLPLARGAAVVRTYTCTNGLSQRSTNAGASDSQQEASKPQLEMEIVANAPAGVVSAAKFVMASDSATDVGCWRQHFDVPLNLSTHRALSLTVHGDNSGALLNVQLESSGSFRSYFVVLDFVGWRHVTLQAPESRSLYTHAGGEFPQPPPSSQKAAMRAFAWDAVDALNLYVTDTAAKATFFISSLLALKESAVTLHSGTLTVGDDTLMLPAGLKAAPCKPTAWRSIDILPCADYVECADVANSSSCRAFDANGYVIELEGNVARATQQHPKQRSGDNVSVSYVATSNSSIPAAGRVEITVFEWSATKLGPFARRKTEAILGPADRLEADRLKADDVGTVPHQSVPYFDQQYIVLEAENMSVVSGWRARAWGDGNYFT